MIYAKGKSAAGLIVQRGWRMVRCEELERLLSEIIKLTGEFQGWEGELKMTPKGDSTYSSKSQKLKQARGRLNEAHKNFKQHMAEHGCQ